MLDRSGGLAAGMRMLTIGGKLAMAERVEGELLVIGPAPRCWCPGWAGSASRRRTICGRSASARCATTRARWAAACRRTIWCWRRGRGSIWTACRCPPGCWSTAPPSSARHRRRCSPDSIRPWRRTTRWSWKASAWPPIATPDTARGSPVAPSRLLPSRRHRRHGPARRSARQARALRHQPGPAGARQPVPRGQERAEILQGGAGQGLYGRQRHRAVAARHRARPDRLPGEHRSRVVRSRTTASTIAPCCGW